VSVSQPIDDVPVFEVKREGAKYRKTRTLHRNLLLPFMCVTDDSSLDVDDTESVRITEGDERSEASVPHENDDDDGDNDDDDDDDCYIYVSIQFY